MGDERAISDQNQNMRNGLKRRRLLRLGALATTATGLSGLLGLSGQSASDAAETAAIRTPLGPSASDKQLTDTIAAEVSIPGKAARTALDGLFESKSARVFSSKNYATLEELFAAVNSYGGNCIARIEPGSYVTRPLRIDQPFVSISAWGATITLADGSNDDLIRIGAAAMSINGFGGRWDGNRANQRGTSHILNFEEYAGAFRIADRSNFDKMEMINSLTGGVRINPRRIELQFDHSPIRDFGNYGIYFGATDCHYKNGAIGIGTNCVVIAAGANWVTKSGLYSATDYAIKLTEKAADCFIVANQIDNNIGGAICAVGRASDTLNTLIEGNMFRGNSRVEAGAFPDIYLEQVRNVLLVGNVSGVQQGSNARTSHAVKTGAGVGFINASANMWDPTYHTIDTYSDYGAIYSRQQRSDYFSPNPYTAILRSRVGSEAYDRFELQANGTIRMGPGTAALDASIYREASGTIRTDGAWKAPKFTLTTSGGAFPHPFIYFEGKATRTPTTGPNTAYIMHRDNGSGKGELIAVFPSGQVQVIAAEQ